MLGNLKSSLGLAAASMHAFAATAVQTQTKTRAQRAKERAEARMRERRQARVEHDFESRAAYRHFMITAPSKEIRAWNRAVVEKAINKLHGPYAQRRADQLQRGM